MNKSLKLIVALNTVACLWLGLTWWFWGWKACAFTTVCSGIYSYLQNRVMLSILGFSQFDYFSKVADAAWRTYPGRAEEPPSQQDWN